jgi:hypothetical protein
MADDSNANEMSTAGRSWRAIGSWLLGLTIVGTALPGLLRAVELHPGRYQPIEFLGPPGISISFAVHGAFGPPLSAPVLVGMLERTIYRLRVTGIPYEAGSEVFPTIEIIDTLCPPPGQAGHFPIPVELTEDDLRLAMSGHYVTRVIYVEDPHTALPGVEDPRHPNWFDAGPGKDAFVEAKRLGRPVAILRMGGRLPDDQQGPDNQFLAGCPPIVLMPRAAAPARVAASLQDAGGVEQPAVAPVEAGR